MRIILTIAQPPGAAVRLDDDSDIDMEAPADLVTVAQEDGAGEADPHTEISRETFATAGEASSALANKIRRPKP